MIDAAPRVNLLHGDIPFALSSHSNIWPGTRSRDLISQSTNKLATFVQSGLAYASRSQNDDSYNVCQPVDIEPRQLFDLEVGTVKFGVGKHPWPYSLICHCEGIFKNLVG